MDGIAKILDDIDARISEGVNLNRVEARGVCTRVLEAEELVVMDRNNDRVTPDDSVDMGWYHRIDSVAARVIKNQGGGRYQYETQYTIKTVVSALQGSVENNAIIYDLFAYFMNGDLDSTQLQAANAIWGAGLITSAMLDTVATLESEMTHSEDVIAGAFNMILLTYSLSIKTLEKCSTPSLLTENGRC